MARPKRFISAVLLVGYLWATGLAGAGGQVLCREPDGTVSVEFSFSRCCPGRDHDGRPPAPSAAGIAAEACSCIDTPMAGIDAHRTVGDPAKASAAQHAKPAVPIAVLSPPPLSCSCGSLGQLDLGPPVSAASTAHLTTVILRC